MKYFSLFFSLVFLLFAYWQLNDPDPVWWVTLYLVPAFISFRASRKKYSLEGLVLLSVLYSAYAINSYVAIGHYEGFFTEGAGLAMKTENQELARETGGLCICIATFITYAFYFYNRKKVWGEEKDMVPGV